MPTVSIDGVTLHYEERGRGLPVLLLHAFPLSGELFEPQLSALGGRFRLIVPDLRGFGRSTGAGTVTGMERFAKDGFALLDTLGIQAAVVGGVSMGGYAAMAMLREDPGRVKGLVLIDTQAAPDDAGGQQRREENAKATLRDGVEFLVQSMVPRLLPDTAAPEVRAKVEAMIRRNHPEGAAAATRGMALRPDSKDILARYSGPALVVVGEKDAITPPEKAQQMAELITGATLVQVPGAGHLSNLERPEVVNRALEAFLAGIPE